MRRFFVLFFCVMFLCPAARAEENPKYLALTFDDGPSGRYTQVLLKGLAERGARATFFLCGYRLEQYPELAQEILDGGHEIGIHGYSHKNMQSLSRRDIARELEETRALLPENCPVRFLRPPGGCCSDGVQDVAEVTRLAILDWSVDPRDWATRDAAAIGRSVVNDVRDGDVVLLHDMTMSSVNAALNIVDCMQARGFEFVTVSELARLRNVRITAGSTYKHFPPPEEKLK